MTVKYVRMIKERLPPAVLQEVITIINTYVQGRLTWAKPRYEIWFGLTIETGFYFFEQHKKC